MTKTTVFDTLTGLATGKTTTLSSPSAANTRTPGTTYASQYPYNYSQVTRAGHEIQLDDTPGNERVRIAHKSGSYTEVSEDGRKVEVVTANESKTVKQSTTITIEKNGDIKIGGAARIVVGGDAHLEVKGNMTQTVGGSYNMVVKKDYNLVCEGNIKQVSSKNSTYEAVADMYSWSSGKNFYGGTLSGDTIIKSSGLFQTESMKGSVQAISAQNMYLYAENYNTVVSNKNQTKLISLLGSTYIGGNTFVSIRGQGSDPTITPDQYAAGATPPRGGNLYMSGNSANFTAKTMNSWEVNGAGFVWKYTSGGYTITNYSQGVPSTSQPPSPPDLHLK